MSATPTAERSRVSRSLIVIISTVIIAVVAVAYVLWGWQSAGAAANVQVVAGPGPIRCDDGVLPVRLADEGQWPAVVVRINAKRGAWCQVPISVRNDSSHTITVRDMTFPTTRSGSDAAGPLVVTDDGSGRGPVGSKESMDAVFKVDEQIAPGDHLTRRMRVEINPNACVDAGLSYLIDVPLARFSVLHRNHETRGAIALQAKIGDEGLTWSGCSR